MSKINKKSIGITYTNAEIEKYIRGRDKLTILNKAMKNMISDFKEDTSF